MHADVDQRTPLADPSFWHGNIRLGMLLQAGIAIAILPYVLFADGIRHRSTLALLAGAALLLLPVLHRVDWDRAFVHPRVMWLFYAWSAFGIAIGSIGVAVDGGLGSPLAWLYLLPLLYAAICYPRPAFIVITTCTLAVIVALGVEVGSAPASDLYVLSAIFVTSAWVFVRVNSANNGAWIEEVALTERLAELANRDGLTGCLNHRSFHESLRELAEPFAKRGRHLTVVLVDLDHFKEINDRHGHQTGDDVLAAVGRALRDNVRGRNELVGRLGGEEFAVLLPDSDLESGVEIANRLRRAVGEVSPVSVTASLGVASHPIHTDDPVEIVDIADRALYAAKSSGRDVVVVHGQQARRGRGVDQRVSDLLASDRVRAHFQPIVDLADGRVVGLEALARIEDSRLRPDQWLDLAEQAGLRALLEEAMLDAALDGYAAQDVPDDCELFVNLSPDVLVAGAIRTRLDRVPSGLVIEISEREAVRDYEELRDVMQALTSEGVRFAIDDVGAGHANMRHIMELAPTYVKLDRSLCAGVDGHGQQALLVEAFARFAADSDVRLIGEGIETLAESRTLHACQVHLGQGWFFGRPSDPAPHVTFAGHATTTVQAA